MGAIRMYCTVNDVKEFLPTNIVTQGQNPTPNPRNPAPETLTNVNVEFFIQQASAHIDAVLGTMYDVPLKKVNQAGEIAYPYPIPTICAALASQMIWERRLQGSDRQRSEAQKEKEKNEMDKLAAIQNGELKLFGQRATRGSRFVRGTLWNAPRNPAEGGRTKGNG